jgi:hypothetical protein
MSSSLHSLCMLRLDSTETTISNNSSPVICCCGIHLLHAVCQPCNRPLLALRCLVTIHKSHRKHLNQIILIFTVGKYLKECHLKVSYTQGSSSCLKQSQLSFIQLWIHLSIGILQTVAVVLAVLSFQNFHQHYFKQ